MSKLAFWRKAKRKGDLGVFISEMAIWVYPMSLAGIAGESVKITVENKKWALAFETIKLQFGLANLHIVLASSLYQLLQVDKPGVDADEIAQALIWSIKDMVAEPVNNIHLDYFETSIAHGNKINAVVSSKTLLSNIAQVCDELGFSVAGITIEELVLSNLFADQKMSHMLVTHIADQELLLTVVKSGELLMQRRVRGFNQLSHAKSDELKYGLADSLSLEIQRSMDYFESQLRQAPVSVIDIFSDGDNLAIANLVAANFNQQVNAVKHQGVSAMIAQLALSEFNRGDA